MTVHIVPHTDGTESYEVDYRYNGQRRRRRFPTPAEAEGFAAAVADICRRWPLQPLAEAVRLSIPDLAERVRVSVTSVAAAVHNGLSDVQADTWAVRAGYHPAEIWGWDWIEAGTAFAHIDPDPDPADGVEAAA